MGVRFPFCSFLTLQRWEAQLSKQIGICFTIFLSKVGKAFASPTSPLPTGLFLEKRTNGICNVRSNQRSRLLLQPTQLKKRGVICQHCFQRLKCAQFSPILFYIFMFRVNIYLGACLVSPISQKSIFKKTPVY